MTRTLHDSECDGAWRPSSHGWPGVSDSSSNYPSDQVMYVGRPRLCDCPPADSMTAGASVKTLKSQLTGGAASQAAAASLTRPESKSLRWSWRDSAAGLRSQHGSVRVMDRFHDSGCRPSSSRLATSCIASSRRGRR